MSELPHIEETSNELEPIGPSTRHRIHPVRSRASSFLRRISQKAGGTPAFFISLISLVQTLGTLARLSAPYRLRR